MGFPGDYRWTGSERAIGQMIANAVPAGMASAIAGALYVTPGKIFMIHTFP